MWLLFCVCVCVFALCCCCCHYCTGCVLFSFILVWFFIHSFLLLNVFTTPFGFLSYICGCCSYYYNCCCCCLPWLLKNPKFLGINDFTIFAYILSLTFMFLWTGGFIVTSFGSCCIFFVVFVVVVEFFFTFHISCWLLS